MGYDQFFVFFFNGVNQAGLEERRSRHVISIFLHQQFVSGLGHHVMEILSLGPGQKSVRKRGQEDAFRETPDAGWVPWVLS